MRFRQEIVEICNWRADIVALIQFNYSACIQALMDLMTWMQVEDSSE